MRDEVARISPEGRGGKAKERRAGGKSVCEQPEAGPGGGALDGRGWDGDTPLQRRAGCAGLGAQGNKRREVESASRSDCIGGDGGDRALRRGERVGIDRGRPRPGCNAATGERGDWGGWKNPARQRWSAGSGGVLEGR